MKTPKTSIHLDEVTRFYVVKMRQRYEKYGRPKSTTVDLMSIDDVKREIGNLRRQSTKWSHIDEQKQHETDVTTSKEEVKL